VDLRTGQLIETTVSVEEEDKKAPDPAEQILPPWLLTIARFIPGFFSPFTLILSVLALVASLLLFWLASFVFSLGAIMAGISIGAMAFLSYTQALAFLLGGEVRMLPSLLAEFDMPRWGIFFIFAFGPLLLFFLAVIWTAKTISG